MLDIFTRFGAEEAEAEGIAALGLDGQAFLIQLISFLLVFYVLKRFVFAKVVKLLEDRRETIEEGMRLTTEMVAERDKLEKEVAASHTAARKEANEILARTHEQASVMIKDAEETAQAKADKIVADAKARIHEETVKARRKLEQEMVDLVIDATEKVSGEKLDAKKDAALIGRALKGQAS